MHIYTMCLLALLHARAAQGLSSQNMEARKAQSGSLHELDSPQLTNTDSMFFDLPDAMMEQCSPLREIVFRGYA